MKCLQEHAEQSPLSTHTPFCSPCLVPSYALTPNCPYILPPNPQLYLHITPNPQLSLHLTPNPQMSIHLTPNPQMSIHLTPNPQMSLHLTPNPQLFLHQCHMIGHSTRVVQVASLEVVDETTKLERYLAVNCAHPVATQAQLSKSCSWFAPSDTTHNAPGCLQERLAADAVVPTSETGHIRQGSVISTNLAGEI